MTKHPGAYLELAVGYASDHICVAVSAMVSDDPTYISLNESHSFDSQCCAVNLYFAVLSTLHRFT